MARPLPPQMETLLSGYRTTEGDLGPARRDAIRQAVVALSGGPAAADPTLPETWRAPVEKVANASWQVMDEDLEALRREGLSEGELYDLVVTASLAAGEARMRRFFALLPGNE